jgi:RNA polymerase sigma-70 factor (ECF subfamily)
MFGLAKSARDETDPDLILLQRIAAQDQNALQSLYARYASSLLHYLTGRLGDPHLAEEVLQDTVLAIWRSAGRFRGECRVRTWLLTIARNRAINAYRRQVVPDHRLVPLAEAEEKTGSPRDPPGQYLDLEAALQALPDAQRETLELVFYHGLSMDETSRVLAVAPGTVKSRLNRARARLREFLGAGE